MVELKDPENPCVEVEEVVVNIPPEDDQTVTDPPDIRDKLTRPGEDPSSEKIRHARFARTRNAILFISSLMFALFICGLCLFVQSFDENDPRRYRGLLFAIPMVVCAILFTQAREIAKFIMRNRVLPR